MRRLLTSWTNTLAVLGFARKVRRMSKHRSYKRRIEFEKLECRNVLAIQISSETFYGNRSIRVFPQMMSLRDALERAKPLSTESVDVVYDEFSTHKESLDPYA